MENTMMNERSDDWSIWWLKCAMIRGSKCWRLGDNCQILSVSSDNCQLGQLSARTTVSSDNCQLGHLSARTTVRPDNCQVSNCQTKLSELFRSMDNCQTWQFWGRQLSDLTVVSGQLSELTVCEAQLMYHQSKMLTWQYIFVLDICCQHLGNVCH